MNHRSVTRRLSFCVIVFVLLAASSCTVFAPAFEAEVVNPLAAAPEISMPDQNGIPFKLSALQGKVVLLFFGFTNCVDECPTTLAHIKLALGILEDQAADVQVVLVSTDPVRDTPLALQDFLAKFDPSYLGITGSFEELSPIWKDYGVVVLDGGETHSSLVYVIDRQGNLKLRMSAETPPDDMASDIQSLLESK